MWWLFLYFFLCFFMKETIFWSADLLLKITGGQWVELSLMKTQSTARVFIFQLYSLQLQLYNYPWYQSVGFGSLLYLLQNKFYTTPGISLETLFFHRWQFHVRNWWWIPASPHQYTSDNDAKRLRFFQSKWHGLH